MTEDGEIAVLGGGCFWCLEAVFRELDGVREVAPGYAGGRDPEPTYRRVCRGATGHAEVVRVRFDPASLPFRALLEIFFGIHDPTTPNRQGADVGSQYRSIILYRDERQRETAEAVIRELEEEGAWDDPVITEVVPLEAFHPAEPEHREYYRRNPDRAYCQAVITPKLTRARTAFRHRFRS